jgi:hypothetical protein
MKGGLGGIVVLSVNKDRIALTVQEQTTPPLQSLKGEPMPPKNSKSRTDGSVTHPAR